MKFIHFLLLFCSIQFSFAQNKYILALSKSDHQMVVLDYDNLSIIKKIPVGEDPHELIVSENGEKAYVANTSNGAAREINVIDLKNLVPKQNIDIRPLYGAHGLALNDNKLWFTAQGSKSVGRYDVSSEKLEWSIGTGQNVTHLLFVTSDSEHFYTTNIESGTVSIFDHVLLQPTVPPTGVLPPNAKPRLDWIQTLIPAGKGVEGFDVSPNGKELWAVRPDGHIIIIDPEKKIIKQDLDTKVLGLHRLKFSFDGKTVYAVSVKTGDLLFIDFKSRKELKRINAGQGAGLLVDHESNRLFVSCTPNNYISVVDLATQEVIKKLEIGGRPDGMAISK